MDCDVYLCRKGVPLSADEQRRLADRLLTAPDLVIVRFEDQAGGGWYLFESVEQRDRRLPGLSAGEPNYLTSFIRDTDEGLYLGLREVDKADRAFHDLAVWAAETLDCRLEVDGEPVEPTWLLTYSE